MSIKEQQEECASEIAALKAENERLREALERLGSGVAFLIALPDVLIDSGLGRELLARQDFARAALEGRA